MTDIDNDEAQAIAEIKAISIGARHHLQHIIRNWMQVVAGFSEGQELNGVYNCNTLSGENNTTYLVKKLAEKLAAIQEAITVMSEDLRRLGL